MLTSLQWWLKAKLSLHMPVVSKSQPLSKSQLTDGFQVMTTYPECMEIGHMTWHFPTSIDATLSARVQKGAPNCFLAYSSYLLWSIKSFTPTTQHKTMPEDENSLLPSFLLEDSEKEEAEGASIMVRFWPSLRSRHVSRHIETSLLCQRAQSTYKPEMGPRGKPRASPQVHSWLDITHLGQSLTRSRTTLRDAND